jgi:hypothetical protein
MIGMVETGAIRTTVPVQATGQPSQNIPYSQKRQLTTRTGLSVRYMAAAADIEIGK